MKPRAEGQSRPLTLVLPEGFETTVTGGNIYDRRLLDALRKTGADVVVATGGGSWPWPDAAARKRLAQSLRGASGPVLIDGLVASGCPAVVEESVRRGADIRVLVHMPLALDPALDSVTAARLDRLERRTLHAASGLICTSSWAADELSRRHQVEAAIAEPGTDPAAPAVGSVPPRIIQVGTIGPLKNQLVTVAALVQLARFDWTARLIGPVGDSSYAAAVGDAIRTAGLENRISITGQLDGPELDRQWHAADLSVLPSRTETYGMVVAESLAHAVPAVVSAGTGAVHTLGWDAAGQRPGFVVDTAGPGPLTEVLGDWLADPQLRRRVKAAAAGRGAMLTRWESTAAAVLRTLQ